MSEKPIYTAHPSVEIPSISTRCPRCNYGPLNGATCSRMQSSEEARKNLAEIIDPPVVMPEAGDISICWKCKCLLVYCELSGKLMVRAMNRKEVQKLKGDREHWKFIEKLRGIKPTR